MVASMSNIDAEGRVVASKESKLDEAIKWARDLAYGDISDNIEWDIAQRYENVANWLEDYKDYRNANFDLSQVADNRYKDGYAKAIQDFAEALTPRLTDAIYQKDVEGMRNLINDVAEQLKEGGVSNS